MIDLFAAEPRIGVLEASRRLGVARGTVQARLDKLASTGVVTGWGPDLDPEALGFPVTAFLTLEIRQGAGHETVAAHLAEIPEVLEAFTITGAGDMWARVVARSNADLQRVIDQVLRHEGIDRSTTVIALATQIPYRMLPLVSRSRDRSAVAAGESRCAGDGWSVPGIVTVTTRALWGPSMPAKCAGRLIAR